MVNLDGLQGCVWIVVAIAMIGFFSILYLLIGRNTIKSDKLIVPQVQLVIDNNQVDTIYIYTKPN